MWLSRLQGRSVQGGPPIGFYVYEMAFSPLCRQVTNPQRSGSISWSFNKALLLDSGFSITPEKVSHHTD